MSTWVVYIMFKLIAVGVAAYILHAINTGAVTAKDKWRSKTILRDENPADFWEIIVLYSAIALILAFYF